MGNTISQNQYTYLNNLLKEGGGNAEWAKAQLKDVTVEISQNQQQYLTNLAKGNDGDAAWAKNELSHSVVVSSPPATPAPTTETYRPSTPAASTPSSSGAASSGTYTASGTTSTSTASASGGSSSGSSSSSSSSLMNDPRVKNALDEIGRAQVAYDEYVKAGRQDLADASHAYAVEQRTLLGNLGVSSSYYNEDVNLRQRYSGTGPAGQYDPSKPGFAERTPTGSSTPSASGASQQAAGGTAVKPGIALSDPKVQSGLTEIGRAQKAYYEYQLAGRQDLADLCNKYANEQRDALKALGADSSWYNENVDLRSKWTGIGHAGQYNPYKTGQVAGVVGISTPLSDSRVQTMLDSIGRAQTAYDEYAMYNRQSDLGKEAQDYANSLRAQLWDLGVDPTYYNADVNLRSRWKGGVAGDYDPSKPGKVLRPKIDPKQAELNRQLIELKQKWWTARFEFNASDMNKAETAAIDLRKQGAQETDETLKLDNQNGVIWSSKIAYYNAKANLDSAGMKQALDSIANARQYGGTILSDNTMLDQLNNQIYQAKVSKWNAIAFQDDAAKQKAVQSSNAARSKINGDIRLSGSLITDEDTQLDIQNKIKLDAKRDWWNAWASGNTAAMTAANNAGTAATIRGATVTDSKMDQMNNIVWDAKKSWWKAKAEGNWTAMEQASQTADAAYANGASFTKDSVLQFDLLNAQLLAVKTEYWKDYANNAIGKVNPADYTSKMNDIANKADSIYKSGLLTNTVTNYLVDVLNKTIVDKKIAYWEAIAMGNKTLANSQLAYVQTMQKAFSYQTVDPVTKQSRTEVYVDGLIDDNKIKLKFEDYNKQLLDARDSFKQDANSGNYPAALEDLNRIITAKKSGATISHVYTAGVSQGQLTNLLYETKRMYWNSVADLNKAEEDKAVAIGTLLKASQANGGFGANENDERIVNLDKQNSLMLAAKHDYWDAILHMDKNQMNVAKNAMQQAKNNGATINQNLTTKIDEANRQIIQQKLNYWQDYKGSANSDNQSAVAKKWRDMAKDIGADEYVLSKEDQDNDPYMVQYGTIEKRVSSTTNQVSYGANGSVTYTPVTTYRTVSVAGYQSVYNADTGQYSAKTAAAGSSHQLDQYLNDLYQAKVSKWSSTALLATTNSPLVPDIVRSKTAAEQQGMDLRATLNNILAPAGFSLTMDWAIDIQNTAVMDSYTSITSSVNSGNIAAAQTEFDNASKRLAQGATIDIGKMMARPVVKTNIETSGGYDKFLKLLADHESSGGNYKLVNQFGYLGKYQMGEYALIDAGFYINDGDPGNNDFKGQWTDKARQLGITNKEAFLNTPAAQEIAVKDYHKKQWDYLDGYSEYIGTDCKGVTVTASGLLAAIHLVGLRGVKDFFTTDKIPKDGNGTSITTYMKDMGGLDLTGLLGFNPDAGKLISNVDIGKVTVTGAQGKKTYHLTDAQAADTLIDISKQDLNGKHIELTLVSSSPLIRKASFDALVSLAADYYKAVGESVKITSLFRSDDPDWHGTGFAVDIQTKHANIMGNDGHLHFAEGSVEKNNLETLITLAIKNGWSGIGHSDLDVISKVQNSQLAKTNGTTFFSDNDHNSHLHLSFVA